MRTHPVDPVALVAGLLFTLSGFVLLADEHWADLDVKAVSAAGLTAIGLILAIAVIVRFSRSADPTLLDEPSVADDTVELTAPTGPEPPTANG